MGGLSFSIAEFDEVVLRASTPVVVMFLAKWCGPSQQLIPVIDEIAADRNGKIKVIKVDIDDNPFITAKYAVRASPTLIVFKDGVPHSTKVGSLPKSNLFDWLESIGV